MQKGTLVGPRCGGWYCRYYEKHGTKTIRRTKHLGYVKDYPTKTSVMPLLEACMRSVNASTAPAVTLDDFIEHKYLPYTVAELRPSVSHGYKKLWNARIKGLAEAQLRVREYRPADIQALLSASLKRASKPLSARTMSHVKAFLSGCFRYSVLCGVRDMNPVRECRIPKGVTAPKKTYAYSLSEIRKMLLVLDGGLKAAVAIAAFAGLRRAELQGLRWEDYDGKDLSVNQTVWAGHVSDPKSVASRDYVPVIPQLREIIDMYRTSLASGPVALLPNLTYAHSPIRVALRGTGIEWKGWHALRRGLASNLAEMGASDKLIQRVMRHSKVTVTREHYIKVRDNSVDEAMSALGLKIDSMGSAWLS